jgi:hypothetical protein
VTTETRTTESLRFTMLADPQVRGEEPSATERDDQLLKSTRPAYKMIPCREIVVRCPFPTSRTVYISASASSWGATQLPLLRRRGDVDRCAFARPSCGATRHVGVQNLSTAFRDCFRQGGLRPPRAASALACLIAYRHDLRRSIFRRDTSGSVSNRPAVAYRRTTRRRPLLGFCYCLRGANTEPPHGR